MTEPARPRLELLPATFPTQDKAFAWAESVVRFNPWPCRCHVVKVGERWRVQRERLKGAPEVVAS